MSHSPEPWIQEKKGPSHILWRGDLRGGSLGFVWDGRDARRIVACVNFLAGIPTEKLEALMKDASYHYTNARHGIWNALEDMEEEL